MTRKARQMVEWFECYTARYRDAKGLLTPALELKYRHSQRVAENTRLIARGLKTEMIIRGGENIYPKEMEGIICRHSDIAVVAVVGVPDAIYGEEVMACLVLHPDRTLAEEAFQDWCRANMASYKAPKYVNIRVPLPRNILGKLLKKELKAALKSEEKI